MYGNLHMLLKLLIGFPINYRKWDGSNFFQNPIPICLGLCCENLYVDLHDIEH